MVRLFVDSKEIEAEEGTTLLQVCLDNGIYIPNLCYMDGMDNPPASCRLCFVEIEGVQKPVTSCTVTVRDGMVVQTDTASVRRLQRSALKLLLSVHDVNCRACPANKKCALQKIAAFLKVGLKPKRLEKFLREGELEAEHSLLDFHPNRCVLCGRCVYVCQKKHGKPFLTFAKRGFETIISFYGDRELSKLVCEKDIVCVEVCPVAAITIKNNEHRSSNVQHQMEK
jgi:NADH dehydrogenase/NADH:ubiquinone oxidoreductase subunit G